MTHEATPPEASPYEARSHNKTAADHQPNWIMAKPLCELPDKGVTMIRVEGKQIALFNTAKGIMACDNRCPHEGYPLSEGDISGECTLTCNWHNWKFDLATGENLYGGDTLRTYPVKVQEDSDQSNIWLDISEPAYDVRYEKIVRSLHDAFLDHSYDRIAREIARLMKIGADPLDAVRLSIQWSADHLEFGWTHAYASMADWLAIYQVAAAKDVPDDELMLLCLLEAVGHTAFDVLREPLFPYSQSIEPFCEEKFVESIESENEALGVSLIRGGLRDGLTYGDFERGFTRAALAHYNDFGHSLIYVSKVGELVDVLGDEVLEPLLLSLVRNLVFATREDKIPEFRAYQQYLDQWQTQPNGKTSDAITPNTDPQHNPTEKPQATDWHKQGIKAALETTVAYRDQPVEAIYRPLLETLANNMLHFDIAQQFKTQVSVSGNVNWLDFTHGITFANAVRKQCRRFPALWPEGLLQMACFAGRNAAFLSTDIEVKDWKPKSRENNFKLEMDEILEKIFDHGLDEYIVSVHWLKTALAVRQEIEALNQMEITQSNTNETPTPAETLFAALNRFIHSPLKRKQTRRTAYQSLQFISKE